MPVHLFIDRIYQQRFDQYLPKLNRWANRRDTFEKAGNKVAAATAQKRVGYYFDKIHERGSFGDNYRHNLLDQFGLSWERDIYAGLLHEADVITPPNARQFLHFLSTREPDFETRLRKVKRVPETTHAETVQYYRDKYRRLQTLLRQAIAGKENVTVSL